MLRCVSCGKEYTDKSGKQICSCGGPVESEYITGSVRRGEGVWKRYGEFLPCDLPGTLSLREGDTPLIKSEKLSERYGLDLFFKNETVNPTWSFKDRGTVLSLQRALELDAERVGTVSTGNMGVSVAAYGARKELEPLVLVTENIAEEKLMQIDAYGPTIIKVYGDYGELFYKSLEISWDNIYFSNSNSPYRIEGYKTLAFEVTERFVPDYMIMPTSSGGLFRGVMKGFIEMERCGVIDEIPIPVSVQAAGCSPIYRAFESGEKSIKRWKDPKTAASAIANPYPPGGNEVLRKLDEYGGLCVAVSDEEVLQAQRMIASEGIFCQPASAVGVAAVDQLREKGIIEREAEVISIITGSGLKKLDLRRGEVDVVSCDMSGLERCLERELER
ncbi:MAG: threonine synthase [Candidatus Natronoplasma sp.]